MRLAILLFTMLAVTLSAGTRAQSEKRPKPPERATARGDDARRGWSWEGTYEFQESVGRGGEFVEHTIVISRAEDGLTARIEAAGFQTSRSLECEAKVDGSRLNLFFKSYGEDNLLAQYSRGQLLLTLERVSGRKTKILTHWAAYGPVLRDLTNGSVYFKKTR